MSQWTFTSESVTEGHPDKMADQISDAILDSLIAEDEKARVAVETLVTTGLVVVAGEVSTKAYIDIPRVVRDTIVGIGYDHGELGFDGNTCGVMIALDEQSPEITQGVFGGDDQGAGDQGMMFGYACRETDAYMPLPIHVAHRMAEQLTEARRSGRIPYLRPDGKTQVSFEYHDGEPVALRTVVVSAQHRDGIEIDAMMRPDLLEHVIRPTLPEPFADDEFELLVNPSGSFVSGGPVADAGLTGRKIIVDTYRRLRTSRRGRLQRQGPFQGGPVGGIRRPLGSEEHRGRRCSGPLRDPGGLRHRPCRAGLAAHRDVRDVGRRS